MDKNVLLSDFQEYYKLNDASFGLFDYLFIKCREKKFHSDILIAMFELNWPSLLEMNGKVFLKDLFNKEKLDSLNNESVEYWMNLILLEEFFLDDPEGDQNGLRFVEGIKASWEMKLQKTFPNRKFVVELINDEETGDLGLTFYGQ